MGYRDGARFQEDIRKATKRKPEDKPPILIPVEQAEKLYKLAYDRGFKAGQSYDPKWDSD